MIYFIAAIDEKRGLSKDGHIPWHLPTDVAYYRAKIADQDVLMGYLTYEQYDHPPSSKHNYVITREPKSVRSGFENIQNLDDFIANFSGDLWIIGGSLFPQLLDKAGKIYLTRIEADFECDKFFPEIEDTFELAEQGKTIHENGLTFRFQVWERKITT